MKTVCEITRFGFNYGPMVIERLCADPKRGWVAIWIKTPKHRLEITAMKGGKLHINDTTPPKSRVATKAKPRAKSTNKSSARQA